MNDIYIGIIWISEWGGDPIAVAQMFSAYNDKTAKERLHDVSQSYYTDMQGNDMCVPSFHYLQMGDDALYDLLELLTPEVSVRDNIVYPTVKVDNIVKFIFEQEDAETFMPLSDFVSIFSEEPKWVQAELKHYQNKQT